MIKVSTLATIAEKHSRAVNKHDWTGYTLDDMGQALAGEMLEMGQAEELGQITGPHGLIDEAYDAIAVLVRMVETLEEQHAN